MLAAGSNGPGGPGMPAKTKTKKKGSKKQGGSIQLPPLSSNCLATEPESIMGSMGGPSFVDDISIMTSMEPEASWELGTQASSMDLHSCDAETVMMTLKDRYKTAKYRAAELSSSASAVHMLLATRLHAQVASKLYSAVACVLYATMGAMQAVDLEHYIRKKSVQLPAQVFDIREWYAVLKLAKQCRDDGGLQLPAPGGDANKHRSRGQQRQQQGLEGLRDRLLDARVAMQAIAASTTDDLQAMRGDMARESRVLAAEMVRVQELLRSKRDEVQALQAAGSAAASALVVEKQRLGAAEAAHAVAAQVWAEGRARLEADVADAKKAASQSLSSLSLSHTSALDKRDAMLQAAQARTAALEAELAGVVAQHALQQDAILGLSQALEQAAIAAANSPTAKSRKQAALVDNSDVEAAAAALEDSKLGQEAASLEDLRRQQSADAAAVLALLQAKTQRCTALEMRLSEVDAERVADVLRQTQLDAHVAAAASEVERLKGQLAIALALGDPAEKTGAAAEATLPLDERGSPESKANDAEASLRALRVKVAIFEEDARPAASRLQEQAAAFGAEAEATRACAEREQQRQQDESCGALAAARADLERARAEGAAAGQEAQEMQRRVAQAAVELAAATSKLADADSRLVDTARRLQEAELARAQGDRESAQAREQLTAEQGRASELAARITDLEAALATSRAVEVQEMQVAQAVAANPNPNPNLTLTLTAVAAPAPAPEAALLAALEQAQRDRAELEGCVREWQGRAEGLQLAVDDAKREMAIRNKEMAGAAAAPGATGSSSPAPTAAADSGAAAAAEAATEATADAQRLRSLLAQAREQLTAELGRASELAARITDLEAALAASRAAEAQAAQASEAAALTTADAEAKTRRLQVLLAEAREHVTVEEENAMRLSARIQALEDEGLSVKHQVDRLEEALRAASTEAAASAAAATAAATHTPAPTQNPTPSAIITSSASADSVDARVRDLQVQLDGATEQLRHAQAEAQRQISALETQHQQAQAQRQGLEERLMARDLSADASKQTIKALRSEMAALQLRISALQTDTAGPGGQVAAPTSPTRALHAAATAKLRGEHGMPRPREHGIVLLQALARGMSSRFQLRKIIAKHNGALVAADGTRQGESGWYVQQGQYFYFVCDEGEHLLLCGPISHDMYLLAAQEAQKALAMSHAAYEVRPASQSQFRPASREDKSLFVRPGSRQQAGQAQRRPVSQQSMRRLRARLVVDRVGISATRVQMEVLLGDIRDRTLELSIARNALSNYQKQVAADMERLQREMLDEADDARAAQREAVAEWQARYDHSQACLLAAQKALEAEKRASTLRGRSSKQDEWQERFGGVAASLGAHQLRGLIRLQALTRGALERSKLRRLVLTLKARSSGVLMAMPNTAQGSSGWYSAPTGEIFYFIHDDEVSEMGLGVGVG